MAPFMYLDRRQVLLLSVLLFLFVCVSFSACWEAQLESTRLSSSSRGSRRRMLAAKTEEQENLKKPLKKKTTTLSSKNQTKLTKPNSLSSKNQTKTIKSDNISTKNQTKTFKSTNISTKNQTKTIKSTNISPKNQTKTFKSNNISTKNQTKTNKSDNLSTKNQTNKLVKGSSNSSSKATTADTGLKKLNSTTSTSKKLNSSTSTPKIKKLNSTSKASTNSSKPVSMLSKKSLDLVKASNKTKKATATTKDKDKKDKQTKTTKVDHQTHHESEKANKKTQKASPDQQQQSKKPTKQAPPSWIMEEEEEDDLVSEFKDLPNKFHQTLIPDLERISTTSRAYITKASDELTKGFKPYVGKKYAPTIATIISCAFILIPLFLVSLLCTRIKAYFSLQKILIFIQVYLSIYFTILCISSLVTGLEPLKFLYSTSQSTYLCLQVLQTLAYVFYLLLLLMYLVLVFSTECGLGSKLLGLAQAFVGFAVGLHYYVTVFHRVVLRQPPKTNWKVHGIYATCFLLICVLARADRRKKAYVEDGGGEGKKN